MAKRRVSTAALERLKAKGVKVVVKKAEAPAPVNKPVVEKKEEKPVKISAAPAPSRQTTKKKQWKLENIERDWDGYIKSIILTEL